jgi:hypothetical protein
MEMTVGRGALISYPREEIEEHCPEAPSAVFPRSGVSLREEGALGGCVRAFARNTELSPWRSRGAWLSSRAYVTSMSQRRFEDPGPWAIARR